MTGTHALPAVPLEPCPARPAAPRNLPALTGLRGIAALWVVVFHMAPGMAAHFGAADPPLWTRAGYLGVDLFFILSGFILCHVYSASFRSYSVREHVHFLLIRLARIYPLHAFDLLLLLVITLALPGFKADFDASYPMFTAGGFLGSALLVQNFLHYQAVWNVPAWTLSAEWSAYIVFPAILLMTHKIRRAWLALLSAALSLGALGVVYAIRSGSQIGMGKSGFLRLAAEFTGGCLIHAACQAGLPRKLPWPALNCAVLFSLAAIIQFRWGDMFTVLPFGCLIFSLVQYDGWISRLLSSKIVVLLGEISFSVYLGQAILIWVYEWYVRRAGVAGSLQYWMLTALVLAAMIGVPYLTWRFVERPARTLGRHLADRWIDRPRASTYAAGLP